jgi:SAM-dependent methyltransferase
LDGAIHGLVACPEHHEPLAAGANAAELRCPRGCLFPVRDGIPRFVANAAYSSAFGLQWKRFRRTQLDSHTRTTISRDRLARCLGGSLAVVRGRSVLEVGCGAGRFTEVLLDAGASVFACDLSEAVEANRDNCGGRDGHFVCQADVLAVPARPRSFDVVVALGMIQHTPSPEATIRALAEFVAPGGLLALDHYAPSGLALVRLLYPVTPRALLRAALLRLPEHAAFRATQTLARGLLPLHRALWRRGAVVDRVRAVWRGVSPVYDYYDAYPQLGEHLAEWALLDTHDGLTDRYKHLRDPEQVAAALRTAGLEVLECRRGGNGVEARGRRPS